MVNLPIRQMMPATYWAGLAMLILATILWYFSAETRWYHFLLLPFWTFYIFIGPEMMEVTSRGYDTLDHLIGVSFLDQGRFSDYYYKDWPGFNYLSSFVYKATGVGFFTLAKLLSVSFHLLRMVFIWYLGTRLFRGKKEVLLFSVLLVGFYWEPQAFDLSPQHLAILMMLPVLALCFSAEHRDWRRRTLVIILFAAMVITHVLTPFIMALLIIFFSLMALTGRYFGYSRDIRGYVLATLFFVMFTAYILFTADWVFKDAVNSFINAFLDPLLPTRFLIPDSIYEEFTIGFVYLFYIVILLWMLIIAARRKFWTNRLERLFPLLCLVPVSVVILPYGMASLPRLYILGVPFIVWFLVKESRHLARVIVTSFLVVLLVMSFGERYTSEYVTYVPTQDFANARFVCDKIPLSLAGWVYEPSYKDPMPISRANRVDQPPMEGGRRVEHGGQGLSPRFPFAVRSTRTDRFMRFHWGEDTFRIITGAFYSTINNIIYTNGDSEIYAYRSRELRE